MTWLETIFSLVAKKTERNFTQQQQKRNFLNDKKTKYQSFLYSFRFLNSRANQTRQPMKVKQPELFRCLCFVSFSHNHVNCFILEN